jgi:hypothetical protein
MADVKPAIRAVSKTRNLTLPVIQDSPDEQQVQLLTTIFGGGHE